MNRYLFSIVFLITISELLMAGGNLRQSNNSVNGVDIVKEKGKKNPSTAIDYKSALVDESFVGKLYAQKTNNLEITINPYPIKRGSGFSIVLENTNEEVELKIIDVLGKLVLKKNFNEFVYVDALMERGIYLLIIKSPTNSLTRKLIVE